MTMTGKTKYIAPTLKCWLSCWKIIKNNKPVLSGNREKLSVLSIIVDVLDLNPKYSTLWILVIERSSIPFHWTWAESNLGMNTVLHSMHLRKVGPPNLLLLKTVNTIVVFPVQTVLEIVNYLSLNSELSIRNPNKCDHFIIVVWATSPFC